jgi:hypothetical protein
MACPGQLSVGKKPLVGRNINFQVCAPNRALKPVLLAGAKSPLGTQAKMPMPDDNCILREPATRFIVCSWKLKKRRLALAVFGESKKPFVN